jgi:hypothetical protein
MVLQNLISDARGRSAARMVTGTRLGPVFTWSLSRNSHVAIRWIRMGPHRKEFLTWWRIGRLSQARKSLQLHALIFLFYPNCTAAFFKIRDDRDGRATGDFNRKRFERFLIVRVILSIFVATGFPDKQNQT